MTSGISNENAIKDLWLSMSKLLALQNQAPPLEALPPSVKVPTSFPQERLWLVNQVNPNSSAHNIPLTFQLGAGLNIAALKQGLLDIVDRHAILRTRYIGVGNETVGLVSDVDEFFFLVEDISGVASKDGDENSGETITKFIRTPINLGVEFPFKALLVKLPDEKYTLVLLLHHIVFDGWSESILFEELEQGYKKYLHGTAKKSDSLEIQYSDFASWQRLWLSGEALSTLKGYWSARLGGKVCIPALPKKVPSENAAAYTGLALLRVDADVVSRVRAFSKSQGITLFVTLFSAFNSLLYLYCGQQELVIASPNANRNKDALKKLIGYFANILLIKTPIDETLSFAELAQVVRKNLSNDFAHQDLPLQYALEQVTVSGGSASSVMFALQNTPKHVLALEGIECTRVDAGSVTPDFDLFLSITDHGEWFEFEFKYHAALFDKDFIHSLAQAYKDILLAGVSDPDRKLRELIDIDQNRLSQMRDTYEQWLALRQTESADPIAEETHSADGDVEDILRGIWQKLLGIVPERNDNFFDIGGQSLTAVQMLNEIEHKFNKKLPLNVLLNTGTVAQLAKLIREAEHTQLWPLLVDIRINELTTGSPVFGVHGIGGGSLFYKQIAEHIDEDVPFYGLQSLGMDGIQQPLERVEDMALLYLDEIRKVQPQGPYRIVGYSFGGFIALEIAQMLVAQGQRVSFLGMLDVPSPAIAQRKPNILEVLSAHVVNLWNEPLATKYEYIAKRLAWLKVKKQLQDKEYEAELKRKNPELRMYQVLSPNYKAADRYKALAYNGHVTVFRARTQLSRCARFPSLGWDRVASSVDVHTVPGDHYTMIESPNVQSVAEKLNQCLRDS